MNLSDALGTFNTPAKPYLNVTVAIERMSVTHLQVKTLK
ncbi:hypothetical protein D515_02608 [Grimontia indica]|uniref:Uncharacterized protein n=1 Tax=Grimontia indica TaxID=1056512 RepID=R1ICZ4_9GAMM|nr:hypothetical protein D515_02608 [Grimontia indica]